MTKIITSAPSKLKRAREGYLQLDHREAPGVGPEVTRGTDAPVIRAGENYECATITCCHCGRIVILNPMRTRPRGYCAQCDHYVCDSPGCNAACFPRKRLLDEMQAKLEREAAPGYVILPRGTAQGE